MLEFTGRSIKPSSRRGTGKGKPGFRGKDKTGIFNYKNKRVDKINEKL